jgi:hypothetical protein
MIFYNPIASGTVSCVVIEEYVMLARAHQSANDSRNDELGTPLGITIDFQAVIYST